MLERMTDKEIVNELVALGGPRLVRIVPVLARRLDAETRRAVIAATVAAPQVAGQVAGAAVEGAVSGLLSRAFSRPPT